MDSFFVGLFLGAILQLAAASQNTPEITFTSPKQIGQVGGAAELQCSAKNVQDVPVLWTKPQGEDTLFISSGLALVLPDNRYSIRHNETSHTFTLKINNLRSEDAGRYQCVLSISRDNRPAVDVELEVRPAEINED